MESAPTIENPDYIGTWESHVRYERDMIYQKLTKQFHEHITFYKHAFEIYKQFKIELIWITYRGAKRRKLI